MTLEELEKLPIFRGALWMDPNDPRCGAVFKDGSTEWIIGKATIDGETVLCRSSPLAMFGDGGDPDAAAREAYVRALTRRRGPAK